MSFFRKTTEAKPAARSLKSTHEIQIMPAEFKRAVIKRPAVLTSKKNAPIKPLTASVEQIQQVTKALVRGVERRVLVIGGAIVSLVIVMIGGYLFLSRVEREPLVIEKAVVAQTSAPVSDVKPALNGEKARVTPEITTVIPPLFEVDAGQAVDADQDGLTAAEEKLYGTDEKKPDSDEDGYLDGHEVFNLYDPLAPEPSRLTDSETVRRYNNPTFYYNALYPVDWLPRALDESNQELIFTSLTGEFFQVKVQGNPMKLAAADWYARYLSADDQLAIEPLLTKQGLVGVGTPNNQQVYLVDPERADILFIIFYARGSADSLNFQRTFEMFVNSFTSGLAIETITAATLSTITVNLAPIVEEAVLSPLNFAEEEAASGVLSLPESSLADLQAAETMAIAEGYRLIVLGLTTVGVRPQTLQILAGEKVRLYFASVMPLRLVIPALNFISDVSPARDRIDLPLAEPGVFEYYFIDQNDETLSAEFYGELIVQ